MLALIALVATAWGDEVLVSARYLPPGAVITEEDLRIVNLPPEYIPDAAIRDPRQVVGRMTREPILDRTLLRQERLAEPETTGGLQALVPRGLAAVRVPLAWPRSVVRPMEMVDVLQVDEGGACVVTQGALVVAAETADGKLWTDPRRYPEFVAVHVAVPVAVGGSLAALAPDETELLVRNPVDVGRVEGLPSCDGPREAVVARIDELPARESPAGTGRVIELMRGDNAFVGQLELAPGATVPTHRDASEEYLVVLEGSGTLSVDGEQHEIGPGTVVYMPAGAEVSYTNGSERLVAVQVFAGPGPARKYESWKAE